MFSFFSRSAEPSIWNDPESSDQLFLLRTTSLDPDRFQNWKRNRPPDPTRIQDIASYFELNQVRLVPGIVYVWERPGYPCTYVYDGIHRLMAAFQTPLDMQVLIYFKRTAKEQEIIDDFTALNKSISVPQVYLPSPAVEEDPAEEDKKDVCIAVVDALMTRYPAFVSPARKPAPQNFNRDQLTEYIASWKINFSQKDLVPQILEALAQLNQDAKAFVAENEINVPLKCKKHDFYLFFLSKALIQSVMENKF